MPVADDGEVPDAHQVSDRAVVRVGGAGAVDGAVAQGHALDARRLEHRPLEGLDGLDVAAARRGYVGCRGSGGRFSLLTQPPTGA